MSDQANPKLISISESLPPDEKQKPYISYTRIHRRIAWSYEDMHGLNPREAMHHLNVKPDPKSVKQNNNSFTPILWKRLKLKFTSSSNVASFERNNTYTRLVTLKVHLEGG